MQPYVEYRCIIGARREFESGVIHLTEDDMELLARWISIGLASRAGIRGRRQKNVMVGPWNAWAFTKAKPVAHQLRLHRTDFTFRVCLLIEGFRRAGLAIEQAAEKVAEYDFVKRHFQNSQTSAQWKDLPDIGATLRTSYYYPFLKRWPHLDLALENWCGAYLEWRKWVISADSDSIAFAELQYREQDHPEYADQFRSLVDEIRKQHGQNAATPEQVAMWFRNSEQKLRGHLRSVLRAQEPTERSTSHQTPTQSSRSQLEGSAAQAGGTYSSRGDVAIATVTLARFYHRHEKWRQATIYYKRALGLYNSKLIVYRIRVLVPPWIALQVVNCQNKKKPDPAPLLDEKVAVPKE